MFLSHPGGSWIFLNSWLYKGKFWKPYSIILLMPEIHCFTGPSDSSDSDHHPPSDPGNFEDDRNSRCYPVYFSRHWMFIYNTIIIYIYIYITQPFLGSFRWHKSQRQTPVDHGITNLKVCKQSYGTTNPFHCKGETQSQGIRNECQCIWNYVPDDMLPHFST